MKLKGVTKWFSAAKGYGFVNADNVEGDIFVHFSSIVMEGYKTLKEGQVVEFELIDSDRGPQAANVTPVME